MTKSLLDSLIVRMHDKLNRIIVDNNFDLQHSDVISYSQKLDKVLVLYNQFVLNENYVSEGIYKNIKKIV